MPAEKHTRPLLGNRCISELVKGPVTPDDLASRLGISRPALTRLLRALQEDGLELTRTPDPEHASYVHLSVSRAALLRAFGLK